MRLSGTESTPAQRSETSSVRVLHTRTCLCKERPYVKPDLTRLASMHVCMYVCNSDATGWTEKRNYRFRDFVDSLDFFLFLFLITP